MPSRILTGLLPSMSCSPVPPPPTQEKDGGTCLSMSHRGTGNMGAPDTCLLGATPDAASRGRRRRRGRRTVGMFVCVCAREKGPMSPGSSCPPASCLGSLTDGEVRNATQEKISHLVATTQPRQQVTRQNIHPPGSLVLYPKGKQDLIIEVAVVVPPPLLPVH